VPGPDEPLARGTGHRGSGGSALLGSRPALRGRGLRSAVASAVPEPLCARRALYLSAGVRGRSKSVALSHIATDYPTVRMHMRMGNTHDSTRAYLF
jgi:hypothetical protein